MADIDKLRSEYEQAEAKAHALQADKDEAMQKVLDKYRDKMRDANAKAAEAQKAFCDAEAAQRWSAVRTRRRSPRTSA
jgi:Skp family chaperone for outer membrane proteins